MARIDGWVDGIKIVAQRRDGEREMDALVRSFSRRVKAAVTAWPLCRHAARGVYYDARAEVFREVQIETLRCDCG